ncbi:dockerin type I repeat-containing protein [Methanoculleus sp. 10]|uniref:dockerin type I repeat-containing protein n=1 Tax=Methanoculleus sp. 10 TaxID=430615 RepID=UPI0025D14584|nr:dockerin type I repeat-containing protein [Methanoculleus sp. 10]
MPPAIEDTTDDAGPNRWNAAIKAMKSFNSTIASSGGRATISVEIPTLTRNIGTVELNDTVVVRVHNASGWFVVPSSGYSLEGSVLTLFNIDTADVDQVSIGFEGRRLGDVDNNGRVQTADAIYIARYLVGYVDLNSNAAFYADTDDLGSVRNADAIMVARYLVGLTDDNFQPL